MPSARREMSCAIVICKLVVRVKFRIVHHVRRALALLWEAHSESEVSACLFIIPCRNCAEDPQYDAFHFPIVV